MKFGTDVKQVMIYYEWMNEWIYYQIQIQIYKYKYIT